MTDDSREKITVWPDMLVICVAIAICVMLAATYIVGTMAQAQSRDETEQTVARENASFCTEFGLSIGTSSYIRCVDGISELRRLHEKRVRSTIVGIL